MQQKSVTKTKSSASIPIPYRFKPDLHSSSGHSSSASLTIPTQNVIETNRIVRDYDHETGNKTINNYMIIGELGRGSHGKVKLAVDIETKERWAIKIVDKVSRKRLPSRLSTNHAQNHQLEKIRKEIAILKKCCHPNVVRLKEVIDDPQADKIYLVLEYLEGGDIIWQDSENPLKPVITENEARRIFRDVLNGIEYLHYQGVVHRDIKPSNLLLSADKRVKLADFGVSLLLSSSDRISEQRDHDESQKDTLELAKTAGSPAFFPPELCASDEDFSGHNNADWISQGAQFSRSASALVLGAAIDVWAIGVTLYCMVFGRLPFVAESEFELFNAISNGEVTFPEDEKVDPALQQLLERLLRKDPVERMTVSEAKQHPWTTMDMTESERREWLESTSSQLYQEDQRVQVSEEDLNSAFTVVKKIRKQFRKISATFHNLTMSFRKRSVSMPSVYSDHVQPKKHQNSSIKTPDAIKPSFVQLKRPPTVPPPLVPHLPVAPDMKISPAPLEQLSIQNLKSEDQVGQKHNTMSPSWSRWPSSPQPANNDEEYESDNSDDIVALERERIRQWSNYNKDKE